MSERCLDELLSRVAPARRRLAAHGLYGQISGLETVQQFMQHHVFAVWDFLSLLKSLQRSLTCVDLPWRPVGNPVTRRLINEIVLEEESDVIDGVATGHFEYYLSAMRQAAADVGPIEACLSLIAAGSSVDAALRRCGAPEASCRFTRATFSLLKGPPHVVAAAFTIGREDSIPTMFNGLLKTIGDEDGQLGLFRCYLLRHLELDGDEHGPKALQMLRELCGSDETRWEEATRAALDALDARLHLWDGISQALAAASSHSRLAMAG